MFLRIRMTDRTTGEILYNQDKVLACQFHKSDAAFNLMHKVLESCVRGVRLRKCEQINLSIDFCEPLKGNSPEIPFSDDTVF